MRTLTYYEKYKELYRRWKLDKAEVDKILDRAFNQLIEELIDSTPWELSYYYKDVRTYDEYVYDLIEGRLFEDLLILWYQNNGNIAKRVGSDANNHIIRDSANRISTDADLEVNGELIEVQVSRNGKRGNYHIKKNKGDKILEGINKLMFVVGDEYFMVGADEISKAPTIKNPYFGGKLCYEITDVVYNSF